jgi:hypothetical protein
MREPLVILELPGPLEAQEAGRALVRLLERTIHVVEQALDDPPA